MRALLSPRGQSFLPSLSTLKTQFQLVVHLFHTGPRRVHDCQARHRCGCATHLYTFCKPRGPRNSRYPFKHQNRSLSLMRTSVPLQECLVWPVLRYRGKVCTLPNSLPPLRRQLSPRLHLWLLSPTAPPTLLAAGHQNSLPHPLQAAPMMSFPAL